VTSVLVMLCYAKCKSYLYSTRINAKRLPLEYMQTCVYWNLHMGTCTRTCVNMNAA